MAKTISIKEEVAKAKAAGMSKFESAHVHECGQSLRYTNSHGECVYCKLQKIKIKRAELKKGKERSIEIAVAAYKRGDSLQKASAEGRISNHSLRSALVSQGLLREKAADSGGITVGYSANELRESSACRIALGLMKPRSAL
ncbi:hypothetical protein [Shewanella xiamenensis]|uniref:hypothetical protein n=1 Tax=Shewanella xiamenensis TaxID=332186 RepID=UPI001F060A21|nr:hypothetical protein [Shewanella xiamenensis]UML92113.1 hypothetical protein MKD32_11640 [Shewanella xiamenensis]